MTLKNLIQSGGYDSPQSAYNAITSPTIKVPYEEFVTWNGIAKFAGKQNVKGLFDAIKDAGYEAFNIQLGGKGLQLTDPDVREMLSLFVIGNVAGAQALLDKGLSFIAPYQQANIERPTLEQVTTEWNAWKAETDLANLRESIRIRLDVLFNQIGTSEQAQAVAELRLIAHELEM